MGAASSVQSVLEQEAQKPMDGSDLSSASAAKEEVVRLRKLEQ
eukprot:CAMPEP_0117772616 /NCGR_PEP_ID=MMETSP0947-20121206/25229_1 /TAXON_ID=44440 /ORGANISM="Chattonella subsalsa, Strain CCMP2191" /LENGTH=42 /DNA_ID= /DNA_START= /DNA_END= /DNA_ORIENTATION=